MIAPISKLYATASASTEAAATVDMQTDGFITMVLLEINMEAIANAVMGRVEISFASASGFTTNDTRTSIAGLETVTNLVTSGMVNNSRSIVLPNLVIPVTVNQRVYLHIGITGTATVRARAWLYCRSGGGGGGRGRAAGARKGRGRRR